MSTSREFSCGCTLSPPMMVPVPAARSAAAMAASAGCGGGLSCDGPAAVVGFRVPLSRSSQDGGCRRASAAASRRRSSATRSARLRLVSTPIWVVRKSGSQS